MESCSRELSADTVRDALKAELAELFGTRAQFRELLRQEVLSAMGDLWWRETPEGSVTGRNHSNSTTSCGSAADQRAAAHSCEKPPPESPNEQVSEVEEKSSGSNQPAAVLERVATDNSMSRRRVTQAQHAVVSERPPMYFFSERPATYLSQTQSSLPSLAEDLVVSQHFHTVAMPSHVSSEEDTGPNNRIGYLSEITARMSNLIEQEPPAKTGRLHAAVTSPTFEGCMRLVIVANCAFMAYLANENIKAWDRAHVVEITTIELVFLAIYFCEMVAKLIVYRTSYFFEKANCFDCFLVCVDVWDLVTKHMATDAFAAGYLRVFRLLKLGKAFRAVQAVRGFEKLQAFLICINGSLSSLGWSLVMLGIVLYIFSLCIVQVIAFHFRDSGDMLDEERRLAFQTSYGSVQTSMLTLFQLSTDGSGWKDSYDLISQTGWIGSMVFLAYVSFTHIAVINIITGIFVESAMQNLAPDRDSLALDHHFREQQAAQELEQLFKGSSDDCHQTTVSKQEFDVLIKAGRLPRLLSLLGLREKHARDFFKFLSSASPGGNVCIHNFVRGCMKLKGSATSFDLHMLQVDVQTIARTMKDLKRRTKANSSRIEMLTGSMPDLQTFRM